MEEKYIFYYSPLQDRSDHIKGQHRQEILSELAQGVLDKGRMLRSILQCKSTSNTLYEIINVARAGKKKKAKGYDSSYDETNRIPHTGILRHSIIQ